MPWRGKPHRPGWCCTPAKRLAFGDGVLICARCGLATPNRCLHTDGSGAELCKDNFPQGRLNLCAMWCLKQRFWALAADLSALLLGPQSLRRRHPVQLRAHIGHTARYDKSASASIGHPAEHFGRPVCISLCGERCKKGVPAACGRRSREKRPCRHCLRPGRRIGCSHRRTYIKWPISPQRAVACGHSRAVVRSRCGIAPGFVAVGGGVTAQGVGARRCCSSVAMGRTCCHQTHCLLQPAGQSTQRGGQSTEGEGGQSNSHVKTPKVGGWT